MAARRLQWLYRKRQEEREKEECEMKNVLQPAMKRIYKGHRNARTMVRCQHVIELQLADSIPVCRK